MHVNQNWSCIYVYLYNRNDFFEVLCTNFGFKQVYTTNVQG